MGKHRSRPSPPAAALLALWAAAGAAEEQRFAALPTELDIYGEVPVVLTASRLAQPLDDAPAAVTVIDRELIRLSGAREIVDLFRLVPGMLLITDNAAVRAVTLHGLADVYSRRFQVLVDGHSVFLPSIGGVPWADLGLSLDDIERIEVIRGPNGAAYGSNAFLGVINIITRHSAETTGDHLRLRAGQHHIRDTYLRVGRRQGGLNWRLGLGRDADRGFDGRPDSRDLRFVGFRADWQAGPADSLTLKAGHTGGEREDGRFGRASDPPRPVDVWWSYLQARWVRSEPGVERRIQASFTRHRTRQRYTSVYDVQVGGTPVRLQVPRHTLIASHRWELEAQESRTLRDGLRLLWGLGVRLDRVRASEYFYGRKWLSNSLRRLFANVEHAPGRRWTLQAGVMGEDDGLSGFHLSWRQAANFHPAPGQTLRAAVSRGFRNPLLVEQKGDGRITASASVLGLPITVTEILIAASGGLRPERVTSRELGYVGRFGRLLVDARAYHEDIDDIITPFERPVASTTLPGGGVYYSEALDFSNRLSAEVRGAELGLAWRSRRWRVHGSYAYTRIRAWGDPEAGELERSGPRHVWSLLVSRRLPKGWQASATYYFIGAWEALGFADPIGAVRRLDLRLERSGGRTHPWRVALVAQNLLDTYAETRNRPGKGPNFFDTRLFVEVAVER